MKTTEKITIFSVSDDALFVKALKIEFLPYGYFTIIPFAKGKDYVKNLFQNQDFIILDYYSISLQSIIDKFFKYQKIEKYKRLSCP